VASWLNPSLAAHLEQAEIFTLAQLVDHINGIGMLWYQSIRAMGVAKACLGPGLAGRASVEVRQLLEALSH
jgi:hypothetical protein